MTTIDSRSFVFIRGGRRDGAVCQALDPGKEVRGNNMGGFADRPTMMKAVLNTQPFESSFSFSENGPIRNVCSFRVK